MNTKTILHALLSIIAAIVLLAFLINTIGLTTSEILSSIQNFPNKYWLIIFLLTVIITVIGQQRWLYLQKIYRTKNPFDSTSTLFYTSLSANLSQIVPVQFSNILSRSGGSWIEKKSNTKESAGLALLEQMFDSLPSLAGIIPSILFLSGSISLAIALTLWAVILFIPVTIYLLSTNKIERLSHVGIPLFLTQRKFWKNHINHIHSIPLPQGKTALMLFLFSISKISIVGLRCITIALILIPNSSWQEIFLTVPVMQVSTLITLTPGSLGITEWTWSLAISQLAIPVIIAANFVLSHRIITVICDAIFTLMIAFYRVIKKIS